VIGLTIAAERVDGNVAVHVIWSRPNGEIWHVTLTPDEAAELGEAFSRAAFKARNLELGVQPS
jgi:hypothetical protein